jgi:hypothetical protein
LYLFSWLTLDRPEMIGVLEAGRNERVIPRNEFSSHQSSPSFNALLTPLPTQPINSLLPSTDSFSLSDLNTSMLSLNLDHELYRSLPDETIPANQTIDANLSSPKHIQTTPTTTRKSTCPAPRTPIPRHPPPQPKSQQSQELYSMSYFPLHRYTRIVTSLPRKQLLLILQTNLTSQSLSYQLDELNNKQDCMLHVVQPCDEATEEQLVCRISLIHSKHDQWIIDFNKIRGDFITFNEFFKQTTHGIEALHTS